MTRKKMRLYVICISKTIKRMLCAYNCYRKHTRVRNAMGSVKCIDFEVVFAIIIIIAIIIFATNEFIYGFIGLTVFMLGDIFWFIMRDIDTLADTQPAPDIGIAAINYTTIEV